MPKQRKVIKGSRTRPNNTHKFRIGSRKGGVGALSLTVEKLMDLLTSPSTRKRDIPKVKRVLTLRGVAV